MMEELEQGAMKSFISKEEREQKNGIKKQQNCDKEKGIDGPVKVVESESKEIENRPLSSHFYPIREKPFPSLMHKKEKRIRELEQGTINPLISNVEREQDTSIKMQQISNNEYDVTVNTMKPEFREMDDRPLSFHCYHTREKPFSSLIHERGHHKSCAAIKLQKVYKSFRTRRQLADCAVLAEQKWWKVLDFAELKRSSISFFDIEKPESAVSRWSRARTRAAKVGKGLSKDEKARKLALQHWLEAIDPRHRYGHNLQFYYVRWLHCESNQPFFYWLDIGDGKEVNIVDRCPRSRLQQQCIKYLDPTEREDYEVIVESGRFIHKRTQKVVDTTGGPKGSKWIFVLSTSKTLYVGLKAKGNFQHSSFLAGGATLAAGRLVVENGILKAVWPHSGHYLPTEENFQAFMSFLRENNIDLTHVKKAPIDEEDETGVKTSGFYKSRSRKDEQSTRGVENEICSNPQVSRLSEAVQSKLLRRSQLLRSKVLKLEIPSKDDIVEEEFKTPQQPPGSSSPSQDEIDQNITDDDTEEDFSSDGYETAEDSLLSEDDFIYPKLNIFDLFEEDDDKEPIPQETILKRINSHRRTRSYQLGEQLQFRWTTGAGPRIGCVRDYPSRLQVEVMEQLQLSPRSDTSSPRSTHSSPRIIRSCSMCRETIPAKSPLCTD